MIQTYLANSKSNITFIMFLAFLVVIFFNSIPLYAANADDNDSTIANDVCSVHATGTSTWVNCLSLVQDELDACAVIGGAGPAEDANVATTRRSCRQRIADGRLSADIDQSNQQTIDELNAERQPGNLEGDCQGSLDPDNCGITALIRQITDALLVLVGIVVVMMIIIGGIQYSAAGSNPQAVAAAKKKISQALFALVMYLFMGAFLQWLIPGGIF